MANEFRYTFEASTVDKWKHCPSCGEELIEIYTGDYHGHLSCVVCESDNDFTVIVEGGGIIAE